MASSSAKRLTYAEPEDPRVRRVVIRGIERLSGQPKLVRLYERARAVSVEHPEDPAPAAFFQAALDVLDIEPRFDAGQLAKVPRTGPVVFVANHPFGVVDGLALCELALRTRGDVKIMIHRTFFRDEALRRFMLPVDFSGSREAAKRNISVRNEALTYLREGGTVAVFPGGGISTAQGGAFGPVTDLDWKLLPAKLIQAAQATVVPVYFHGHNSRLFQWVSQFSQTLRLSLVIREINHHRGQSIDVVVGNPVPFAELVHERDRRAMMAHLRALVYGLAPETEVS